MMVVGGISQMVFFSPDNVNKVIFPAAARLEPA